MIHRCQRHQAMTTRLRGRLGLLWIHCPYMDGFEKLPAVEEKGCLLQGGVSSHQEKKNNNGKGGATDDTKFKLTYM